MPSQSLRRIVSTIGLCVAVTIAVSVPAGYLFVGYTNLAHELQFRTDLLAGRVAKYVFVHRQTWQYHAVRIAEVISTDEKAEERFRQRVLDDSGAPVVEIGAQPSSPIMLRSDPILVAGAQIGRVEVLASMRPLLWETGLVAAFSSLLGFAMFFAVRIFPLRVLDRTLGALENAKGELQTTNDTLATQNMRFDAALNNMSQGLYMFDGNGRLAVTNRRLAEMFGVPQGALQVGATVPELIERGQKLTKVRLQDRGQLLSELNDMLSQDKSGVIVFRFTDGRIISASHQSMPGGGWVTTLDDVTQRRLAEDRIAYLARHDMLTDLANRVFFYEQMEQALGDTRGGGNLAVFSLDLDHFKSVNDTLGHPVGDKLLQEAARRMLATVRADDIVARLGGDEFAIVLRPVAAASDTTALASRLIETVSAPYRLDGHEVIIGVSVGIAIAPQDGQSADQLMKNADLALYRAKVDGGGAYRFFEPAMDARMQARRALELDLRKAIVNHEFELNYQPQINLKTGRVSGAEALVRWNHPERGKIAPMEFIPLAEETGLIVPLGEWILREACHEAATWPTEIMISVNVSPAQFKTEKLVKTVSDALKASGLPARRLELEITELVLLRETEGSFVILRELHALGVRIAMDDFGTGYSSLGYLRRFPFDKIKIDPSFIKDLGRKEDSLAIIRAVVGLGSSLGITTTAEGVETVDQLEKLRAEGCTEVQGFLFSAARPAYEVRAMFAELNSTQRAVA